MKSKLLKIALPALAALGFNAPQVHATFIPLAATNNYSYAQNFNTLPTSGKQNFSLPGWAVSSSDNKIYGDDGSSTTAGVIYSYGQAGSANRALGVIGNNGNDIFGATFQNFGPGTINSLNISFLGEEWRLQSAGHQSGTLTFQYSLTANNLTAKDGWINVPGLSFSAPNTVGVGRHDGTLAANQGNVASTINFLNIPSGATFWIRWQESLPNGVNVGDGLAIDNFSLSAVPEASTFAAAFGALGLLGGTLWKRKSLGASV
jgi:hypothetical protein